MNDFELTKKCAEWLGIDCEEVGYRKPFIGTWDSEKKKMIKFGPLHDWNDLMTKVVPRLPYKIEILERWFWIYKISQGLIKKGKHPDDLPKAILDLVAEIAKEEK